jgi:hypothetical protein
MPRGQSSNEFDGSPCICPSGPGVVAHASPSLSPMASARHFQVPIGSSAMASPRTAARNIPGNAPATDRPSPTGAGLGLPFSRPAGRGQVPAGREPMDCEGLEAAMRRYIPAGAATLAHLALMIALLRSPGPPSPPEATAGNPIVFAEIVSLTAPTPAPPLESRPRSAPPQPAPVSADAPGLPAPEPEPSSPGSIKAPTPEPADTPPTAQHPEGDVTEGVENADCQVVADLEGRLALDPRVPPALARVPASARSVANALMVWDGRWASAGSLGGEAALAPLRDAIQAGIRLSPGRCLTEPVSGPRLIALPEGSGRVMLAIGSGAWRWAALLDGGELPQ